MTEQKNLTSLSANENAADKILAMPFMFFHYCITIIKLFKDLKKFNIHAWQFI